MQFLTKTDKAERVIEAPSAQEAAQIAERDSEGAAQVVCLDRFGPVETTNWPFPKSAQAGRVPVTALVGDAEF